VIRGLAWADSLRRYRVVVDGRTVGTVSNGESRVFAVMPGRHEVQVRLGVVFRSRTRVVTVKAEGVTTVVCKTRLSAKNVIPNPWNYIDVRVETPGDVL
jgi:hypothetical protein